MFSHFGEILNKPAVKVTERPKKKEKCSTKAKELADSALIQATVTEAVLITEKPVPKLEKIRKEIKKIHEAVSTVQSLIPLLKDGNDGQSLIKQLHDTNDRFQYVLPLMNEFMNEFPPAEEVDMELWKLERENLCREFESTLTNFRTVQKDVMDALEGMEQSKS